jgi:thiamine-phosphate pyrophosphorylase
MAASSLQRGSLQRPLLCYVTDRQLLSPGNFSDLTDSLLKKIEAAIQAGIDWIQIREKDLCARDCAALVRNAVRATDGHATSIFVNDRFDVAVTENASGVHLGGQSIPANETRRYLDNPNYFSNGTKEFLMGTSCHSVAEAKLAEGNGAGYIFFGPIFSTPSKIGFGEPQGLRRLEEVCSAVKIPVLAIGGVTVENARECLSAGASGIAAIRLFQDAGDMRTVVDELRQL